MPNLNFILESLTANLEIVFKNNYDIVKYCFDDFYWEELLNVPLDEFEASGLSKDQIERNYQGNFDIKELFKMGLNEYLINKEQLQVKEFAKLYRELAIIESKITLAEQQIKSYIDEINDKYINELKDNYLELLDYDEDKLTVNLRSSVAYNDEVNFIEPFIYYFELEDYPFYPNYNEKQFKQDLLDKVKK